VYLITVLQAVMVLHQTFLIFQLVVAVARQKLEKFPQVVRWAALVVMGCLVLSREAQ
jgi:hypothetical protein